MSILTVGSIPGGDEEIIRIRKSRSQLSGGARTLGFSHRSQIYAREHAPLRLRTCIPAGSFGPTVTELIFVGAQRFTNRAI